MKAWLILKMEIISIPVWDFLEFWNNSKKEFLPCGSESYGPRPYWDIRSLAIKNLSCRIKIFWNLHQCVVAAISGVFTLLTSVYQCVAAAISGVGLCIIMSRPLEGRLIFTEASRRADRSSFSSSSARYMLVIMSLSSFRKRYQLHTSADQIIHRFSSIGWVQISAEGNQSMRKA